MPNAQKNEMGLLERGRALHKAVTFDRYLRQLVSVYTSPFLQPKYDYSQWQAQRNEEWEREVDRRFQSDRIVMIKALLSIFPTDPNSSTEPNAARGEALPRSFESYCLRESADIESERHEIAADSIAYLCEHPLNERKDLPGKVSAILSSGTAPVLSKAARTDGGSYAPPSEQAALACAILDQAIEESRVPRAFEYDHLDDIVPIVESRYAGTTEKYWHRSTAMLNVLKRIAGCDQAANAKQLSSQLHKVLGDNHPYVPRRSSGYNDPDLQKALGDLFEEMASIKASENVARFREINREYSSRQREFHKQRGNPFGLPFNPWGLPLLSGFEEDHHLMLRTLLSLRQAGAITPEDEVLVVGPRYVDELQFFRKHMGLTKTIGLDLFEDRNEGIFAGDMHDTEFESGRFKLIYCAGTLAYAYDLRKVAAEFARILARPGFLCLLESADRVRGVGPLGRSDPRSVEGLIGCFYRHKMIVHARDRGKTPVPNDFTQWPCVVLELKD